MAIVSGDLDIKLSTKSGSAGSSLSSTGNNSLGKYMATTSLQSGVLNDLFDDVTGDENEALDIEYRCVFLHNTHDTLTLQNALVWMSAEVDGGANAEIAVDDIVASSEDSSGVQAAEISNEGAAPINVGAFSSPTTKGTALALGDIPANSCKAVWVRRTAANSSALSNDGFTLQVEGDTEA